MTVLFPIVLETEASGAVSAYVPGLPVYAAAETHAKAERAIRTVLAAYLEAHPDSRPDARVRVARFSATARTKLDIVGPAALVGAHRSTRRRGPRERTDGSAAALPRTRRHERLSRRHHADALTELQPSRRLPQPVHQPQLPVSLTPIRGGAAHHFREESWAWLNQSAASKVYR